ncbi:unnamed protein product [Effrenium voratum]|nr:unnamed protein product [Effrenium voratum]
MSMPKQWQRPTLDDVSHSLSMAPGAAFFLACLTQRAGDEEVLYETQSEKPTFRWRKFKHALEDLDAADKPVWLCDDLLLAAANIAEDVGGLPVCCRDDLLFDLPGLRPPSGSALWLASAGACSSWRRDPFCWSTGVFVVMGTATARLRDPCDPPPAAVTGHAGAAVAPSSAGGHRVNVAAGQMLVVPPGWWYCLSCSAKILGLQSQCLERADATWALGELLQSLGKPSPNSLEAMLLEVQKLEPLGLRRCLRGTFSHANVAGAEVSTGLMKVMWELSAAYPEFVMSGLPLPGDAAGWSRAALEVFVKTGAFCRPTPRPSPIWPSIGHLPLPGPKVSPSSAALPRIIWMFWAQGAASLGPFRRACISSWQCQNPTWEVVLLDKQSCFQYVDASDLPERWPCLRLDALADALRLALLSRHGGVYVDISVFCVKALDTWLVERMGHNGLLAFYFQEFGRPGRSNHGEYIENWFLACERGNELTLKWHAAFLQFWKGRTDASAAGGLQASSMFKNTDLSCMQEHQKNYLTMHCCFKWLIDSDKNARTLWQDATALLPADAAVGWILDLEGVGTDWLKNNLAGRHAARWLYLEDAAWISDLLTRAPMLKFVGVHASVFDRQPPHHLTRPGSCMRLLLAHGLPELDMLPEVISLGRGAVLHFEMAD